MKTAEKNEFFRQGTAHICGSLEIDVALERCHRYLGQFIPCDDMFFFHYDIELNAFRSVAKILKHQMDMGDTTIMPSQGKALWLEFWEKPQEVFIVNQPALMPAYRRLNKIYGFILDSSYIILRLSVGGQKIGFFTVGARGIDRYTQAHADLVHMLRDPLAICMANALKHQELVRLKDVLDDNNRFFQRQLSDLSGSQIIGVNGGLRHVMQMLRQVCHLDSPILIEGETGVGKGLIANALHSMSKRKEGPFINVNCGAIPDSLLDSELFGHEKGAFTGAIEQKRGRFERADGGTIFLDEVGELPHPAQVRLLHVLQHREIERVGGSCTIPVDIRIISATHRNLEERVRAGKFREDLWYRLNVFPIRIPPLRQRKEDIPALVHYLVEKKSVELKKMDQSTLAQGSIDKLSAYDWPGNVRELQNIVERALIRHTQGPLRFDDASLWHSDRHADLNAESVYADTQDTLLPLAAMTAAHIRKAIALAKGKISGPGGAADLLALNPNTLRKKMEKLQIPYKKKDVRVHGLKTPNVPQQRDSV